MERRKLEAFIDKMGQAELARRLGVSRQTIWQWRRRLTTPHPLMAAQLIKESDGELTFEDLFE